jgi:hypothetical protein
MTDEEQDDQDWLDALAGRSPAGSRRAAIREARRLRDHIQRNVRAPDVAVAERDAQREEQLLERARREGLIDPAQLARRSRRRMRAGVVRWVALAAGIAGIAVAPLLLFRSVHPTEHFRGTGDHVIRIEAVAPKALKMQILDELRAAGVPATGYEQLGVEGIDANLPKPLPPRVRDILSRRHLTVPGNGVLRIEITAPSNP